MCNSLVLQPPPHIIVSNIFTDLKKEKCDFLDDTEGELGMELASVPWPCAA